ncbi:MAG TPA: lysophospholipid acyltransferase family protein [Planctomycetota bacterium]|nr:lysophospholipid acyltransferase family protein [Planctomycetota bacterium]
MLYNFVLRICRLLAIVFLGLRAFGRENIPEGGAVLASNHQSYFDPALISITLNRPVYFLARKELFESNRFFGWFIHNLHAIPLERRTFDSTGLRRAIEVLQNGGLLIVFPEGTRSPNGEIGEIRKGVSLLGEKANVPLVPTLVDGAYQAWPRKHKLPIRFSPITVRFGPPLRLDKTNIETIADAWRKLK